MSEYMGVRPVSLYLHFPFCERKCRYCDFLSGPAGEKTREEYIDLLCREIELRAREIRRAADGSQQADACSSPAQSGAAVDSVFIGGGTPSLMTPAQAARVMETIRSCIPVLPDAEISMEVNPGTVSPEKLRGFKAAGIGRLSIGVQSFDDSELRLLGRIHTSAEARETFLAAREAGFANINLDLMSALPGQNIETWSHTLEEAVSLGPEHISAYSLIIEDGTPLASLLDAGKLPDLPSEEEDRRMYHFTKQFLASKGYRRYEISNYAKKGYECRHNCGYWTGHEYLGLGLGASSCLGDERFRNPDKMDEYRTAVMSMNDHNSAETMRRERQRLTQKDRMEEFMFLGLRMTEGVSESEFERRFGVSPEDVFGSVIHRHLDQKVISRIPVNVTGSSDDGSDFRISLTEYGLDVANYVMADYLL